MIKELIKAMQRGGKHCNESILEVRNATSFGDLFNLMFDYKHHLGSKHFPPSVFVQKHYPHIKGLANAHGFFCDEKPLKVKDLYKVILTGECICDFKIKDFEMAHVVVRHNSKVNLYLGDYSKANVYLSESGTCEIISKTEHSTINVVRYD